MSLPNAITREDFYLNKIANPSDDHELPDAITRAQHYLKAIAENAGGGGGGDQPFIYSETEREVGVWVDGKPLYQKTIHIESLPQTSYDTYQIASDIDTVVNYTGIVFYSGGVTSSIYVTRPDNTNSQFYHDIEEDKTFFFRTYRSEQGEAYVTFQYTKTTDTPGT